MLTVAADGAVPLTYRLCDGNTEDSTTHIGTWDSLIALLGRADFVYVADCKLATRDNLDHIASRRGRLLTVLPRSRKDDERGRAWIAAGGIDWTEISRQPGPRRGDPDQIYWAADPPMCSEEGLRICWIRSSQKRCIDAAARTDRIDRARSTLAELKARLTAARCRLTTRVAVEHAAAAILADTGAQRWVRVDVVEHVQTSHRQEKAGRPGPNTRYRQIETRRFDLTVTIDAATVAYDAAADGCFPFITTENDLPAGELLRLYNAQPRLERRHTTLKSVIAATPLTLKTDRRIDAFGLCLYIALLVHALVERQLRHAMTADKIDALPLYPEDRDCRAPTAARVFEVLDPLTRTTVRHRDRVLAVTDPTLTPLQQRLLGLLGTPLAAYDRPAMTTQPPPRCPRPGPTSTLRSANTAPSTSTTTAAADSSAPTPSAGTGADPSFSATRPAATPAPAPSTPTPPADGDSCTSTRSTTSPPPTRTAHGEPPTTTTRPTHSPTPTTSPSPSHAERPARTTKFG